MTRAFLVAKDDDYPDGRFVLGDKFLFSLTEDLFSVFYIAAQYYPHFTLETLATDKCFVTGARTGGPFLSGDGTLQFITKYVSTGGAIVLRGWCFTGMLWEKVFTVAESDRLWVHIDRNDNVLLRYNGDTANTKWAYLDGTDGSLVGEFGLSDLALNRNDYLTGYDTAVSSGTPVAFGSRAWNHGDAINGYYYGDGWGWDFHEYNYRNDDALPQPPGTWPDYIADTVNGWGTYTPSIDYVFPISDGWMYLGTETFWFADTTTVVSDYVRIIWHLATVQFAATSREGGSVSFSASRVRTATVDYLEDFTGYYDKDYSWDFTLGTDTGLAIANTLSSSILGHGDYTSTLVVDHRERTALNHDKVIAGYDEVWVYSNKEGADYRNYHKLTNNGAFIESLANVVSPSSHSIAFSEQSRHLLIGEIGHDNAFHSILDTDGVDETVTVEDSNDWIQFCYCLESTKDIVEVVDSDAGYALAEHDQLWDLSGDEKVAYLKITPGYVVPKTRAAQSKETDNIYEDMNRGYLGNGFSMGSGYDLATPNKQLYRLNDMVAGSSVANLFLDKTITVSGNTYTLTGVPITKRAEWQSPA